MGLSELAVESRAVARGRGPGARPAGPHVVAQRGEGGVPLEGPRGFHVRDKGPAPGPMTWAALPGSWGCHLRRAIRSPRLGCGHPCSLVGLDLRASPPRLTCLHSELPLCGWGGWAETCDLSVRGWWGISTEETRIRHRAPPRGQYGLVKGALFSWGVAESPPPHGSALGWMAL